MTDPSRSERLLRLVGGIPLFSQLPSDALESFTRRLHERQIPRNSLLFSRGDPADGFYYVLSGIISLGFITEAGDEKVVELIRPGGTFGEAAMLLHGTYPVTATTLQDCRLLCFPLEPFDDLLLEYPAVARQMIGSLSQRLHGLVRQMEDLRTHTARERVISFLLQQLKPGAPLRSVELDTTRQCLASFLNITPETLSRVLHQLEEDRLIEIERHSIRVLDLEALQRMLGFGPLPEGCH